MTRLQPRQLGTAAALAAVLATPAFALADQPAAVSEVVITATRLPAPLDLTPGAYVITAQDIEQRQATFAADVLSTVPGLSVYSSGAFGGLTSLRQRGASSDQTLVLIDGIPVNDASQPSGGFDFSTIDLADVSRVEVLNGPQGSIWGSDAIGGVLAFTTREPNGARLDLEGGSYGTARVSGSIGQSNDIWALGASVSMFSTTGISAADSRNNYAAFPGSQATEPDGTRELTASLRGRLTVSKDVELDAQVRINQSRTQIDGFPPPNYVLADTNDVSYGRDIDAYLHAKVDSVLGLHSDFSLDRYSLARNDDGESYPLGSSYNTSRDVYRWTSAHGGVDDTVSFLVGAERQNARANLSTGSEYDLGTTSAFVVGQWRPFKQLTTSASVRYDDPDIFHHQVTARAGAGYAFGGGFDLLASWGQGFKTPSISQAACDSCTNPQANKSLQPEHAQGEDLGLAWHSDDNRFSARATLYQLDVRDQIEAVYDDVTFALNNYINVPRTRSRGVEVAAEAALPEGFRLKVAYSHDDAFDLDANTRELRVPPNMVSAALFWNRGPVNAALTVQNESADRDYSYLSDLIDRPGFTVASLAGGDALNTHVTLTARIENLADTHYEEVSGYGEPGRSVYIGVRLRN